MKTSKYDCFQKWWDGGDEEPITTIKIEQANSISRVVGWW